MQGDFFHSHTQHFAYLTPILIYHPTPPQCLLSLLRAKCCDSGFILRLMRPKNKHCYMYFFLARLPSLLLNLKRASVLFQGNIFLVSFNSDLYKLLVVQLMVIIISPPAYLFIYKGISGEGLQEWSSQFSVWILYFILRPYCKIQNQYRKFLGLMILGLERHNI